MSNQQNIRNFVIIAHIDHGKSTLADRFLELTGTIEKRKMREQFLDQMDLEREKGITIKMQPVRMIWRPPNHATNQLLVTSNYLSNSEFILNLIDTPGHVDFAYEVSRALAAVEGAILLVDATQGIQAQTISNLHLAQNEGLVIIPAINKIDMPGADIDGVKKEISSLLGITEEKISSVSAKENIGVKELLDRVIETVPPPSLAVANYVGQSPPQNSEGEPQKDKPLRALIFDSHYDSYKGIVAHVRVFDGNLKKGEKITTVATKTETEALEIGYFSPALHPQNFLNEGEIGYIATGIKEPEKIRVGDTITTIDQRGLHADQRGNFQRDSAFSQRNSTVAPLQGYKEPRPVIFASVFPESADDYEVLRDALKKLQLNDASLFFEPESSGVLGRGFKTGFLGMLHMEIISERLKREYNLDPIFSSPSVAYAVKTQDGKEKIIYSASSLPPEHLVLEIQEPWAALEIISPHKFLGAINNLFRYRRINYIATDYLSSDRVSLKYEAPLKEIISGFYDELKSVSEGYGSMAYELIGNRAGDLKRLDILIAGDIEEAFSQILPKSSVLREGKKLAEKLKNLIPPQLFPVAIQASADGRIIARETIPAMKKDVTGYLYGGDRTRKMKLWKKQQKGKKRLKETGKVEIPPEVFLKILKE